MDHGTEIGKEVLGRSRIQTVSPPLWKDYLSLMKPGITLSNLIATVAGFRLAAGGWGQPGTFFWTLAGTFLVVAGGCVWNNVYDRDIDPWMSRTRTRPIPAGRISWRSARWIGWGFSLLGLIILLRCVNVLSAVWGAVGVGWYVFVYTAWFKRKSPWNTVIGGVAGAVPPVIGWTAVTGEMGWPAWVLFFILFFWQPPHFYALALLKEAEYRKAGIPMWPVVRGWRETWEQMAACAWVLLPISGLLPLLGYVSWEYLWVVIPLGFAFGGWIGAGRWVYKRDRWARQVFRLSLVYLLGWMAAVIHFAG
ncbi:heme o synthase [Desmospora profundinema]|uniref:Protoheme IX farnesyltransferase n=1 Tax=Desmospora profundinema TaxID=1571184 RepID=A0ABU1IMS2_9BACL|nr:heme o synthase [Desmospora profundinema]MDR6225847.1 protoheme IX farnesyltransferase [Desmospora profundinema]